MAILFGTDLGSTKSVLTSRKESVKYPLREVKLKLGAPVMLHNFEVSFSNLYANNLLPKLVKDVPVSFDHFNVKPYKIADRMYAYFNAKSEIPISFSMSFWENSRGEVSKFFNSLHNNLYNPDGTVRVSNYKNVLMDISISQMVGYGRGNKSKVEDKKIVTYKYYRCLFIEITDLPYSHSSMDRKALSFTVYARKFEKIIDGG